MKTLLTSSLIAAVFMSGPLQLEDAQRMEMELSVDQALQKVVRVFDYQGNLLKEMTVEDVANDEITISDYLILESSHFAFSYFGDYYYLRD